jgi:hypothetical protein
MTVERVTDPIITRRTPPGHKNRTVRLKYTAPKEMLDEISFSNLLAGRTVCPISDYIAAHLGDDVIAVEDHVWSHPEWGPGLLTETMVNNLRFNNDAALEHGDEIAGAVQHDCALKLTEHPWANTRAFIERMLRHPDMHFKSHEAQQIILDLLHRDHPNPTAFLNQPEVAKSLI